MIDARKILLKSAGKDTVKLKIVTPSSWPEIRSKLSGFSKKWSDGQRFTGSTGTLLQFPDGEGILALVFVGSTEGADGFSLARLCRQLSPGTYVVDNTVSPSPIMHLELAWCLEAYYFDRYKANTREIPKLVCSRSVN